MRFFRLFTLAALLAAGFFGIEGAGAQEAAALSVSAASLTAEDLLKAAMESSPDIASAKNSLAQAKLAYEQTLPFKGTQLSAGADGTYYVPGIDRSPNEKNAVVGSLSVNAPILPNLSAGAGLNVSSDLTGAASVSASGSVSWYPLASNQSAKNAKVTYDLALASYAQALRDVRQSASAKIMGFMDASNALDSAKESLALAEISLKSAETKEGMGETSSSSLLKARKEKAAADRSLSKAENALEKARASLALAIGGELGTRIAAGAKVNAEGIASSEDWKAPAFSELPKKRAVLKAEADLETAKNSVNSWTDATSARNNGPLSLSAGINTDLKITLSGKLSLDLAQIDGSDAKSKKLTIEAAQISLDQALFDAKAEYQDAVDSAQDALLALKDAEYQHELDSGAAEAAKIKWAAASIAETEYRSALSAEKDSAAKESAARLTLAKARSWFVTD
jgi:outer membrane protein TolC